MNGFLMYRILYISRRWLQREHQPFNVGPVLKISTQSVCLVFIFNSISILCGSMVPVRILFFLLLQIVALSLSRFLSLRHSPTMWICKKERKKIEINCSRPAWHIPRTRHTNAKPRLSSYLHGTTALAALTVCLAHVDIHSIWQHYQRMLIRKFIFWRKLVVIN